MHDGEQVLAREALAHLVDLGAGHRRIVGRDVERADRRVLHVQKLFAQPQMIDQARRRRARGLAHRGVVEVARGRRQQQRAAALHRVVAGDAGQQRHGAQRLAAMGEAGHAFAEADQGRLGLAVQGSQTLSMSATAKPGDLGHARRREARQDLALDPIEAQRVPRDVVAVGEPVAHQDVHDAERQGGVGADPDRQIEVGRLGAARAARIDDHDRHAALLALLFGQRPEMDVGGGEIGAPRDHQVGMHDRLRGRRRRPGRPSCPRPSRSRCRTPCRPAGGWRPARGRGRSPGRDSSGPDGRSRRSPAARAGRSPR